MISLVEEMKEQICDMKEPELVSALYRVIELLSTLEKELILLRKEIDGSKQHIE